jgi:hypothetical protein
MKKPMNKKVGRRTVVKVGRLGTDLDAAITQPRDRGLVDAVEVTLGIYTTNIMILLNRRIYGQKCRGISVLCGSPTHQCSNHDPDLAAEHEQVAELGDVLDARQAIHLR